MLRRASWRIPLMPVAMGAVAVMSFFPTWMPLVFATLALILLTFRRVGYQHVLFYGLLTVVTIMAGLWQQYLPLNGVILHFLMHSSLFYAFFAMSARVEETHIIDFARLHVLLSLWQFPIQILQFVRNHGLRFSEFLTNNSIGDTLGGTMISAEELAAKQVISLLLLLMLRQQYSAGRQRFYATILILSFLMTTTNQFLLIGLTAYVLYVIAVNLRVSMTWRNVRSLLAIPLALVVAFLMVRVMFSSQFNYIFTIVSRIGENMTYSGKIRSVLNTIDLFREHPGYNLTGLGAGTFGSRTAFILSGEYLWQGELKPFGIQMSKAFEDNMLPLWNKRMSANVLLNGSINQPFSSMLAIYSEYGLVVFLAFWALLLNVFKTIYRHNRPVLFLAIFSVLMLFYNNYLEYPRVITPVLLVVFFYFGHYARLTPPAGTRA